MLTFTMAQLEKAITFYDADHPDRILIEEAITHGADAYHTKIARILRPLEPRLRDSIRVARRPMA